MPSQKNKELLKSTIDKLNNSSGVILVDYKRLTHRQLESLRNALADTGAKLHITKNSLVKLGIERSHLARTETVVEEITGPTAALFLPKDIVAPIKELVSYIKQNDLPQIIVGYLEEQVLDSSQIEQISKLPSKETLIIHTIQRIQGPLYGLVNVLSANTRELLYALNAIKDSKDQLKGGEQNG